MRRWRTASTNAKCLLLSLHSNYFQNLRQALWFSAPQTKTISALRFIWWNLSQWIALLLCVRSKYGRFFNAYCLYNLRWSCWWVKRIRQIRSSCSCLCICILAEWLLNYDDDDNDVYDIMNIYSMYLWMISEHTVLFAKAAAHNLHAASDKEKNSSWRFSSICVYSCNDLRWSPWS